MSLLYVCPARSLGNKRDCGQQLYFFLFLCEQGSILFHSVFRKSVPFPPLPIYPKILADFLNSGHGKCVLYKPVVLMCYYVVTT